MQLLARFRVALGWVFGPLVLLVAEPTVASLVAGLIVALVGEALRFWAAGHLNKSREVTASGPYRWLSHPLYVGSSLLGLGVGIASHSLIAIGLIALYLALTLTAAIRSEEAFLRRTFGERYDRFKRGELVRDPDAQRRFSLAQATANHEQRAMLGVATVWLLLFLKMRFWYWFL
ncbi:MAG TPA: methyltransferase [Vicinamibacterales bacterium]|nr:methyltransferase [Vicinamibacterales bacterium]